MVVVVLVLVDEVVVTGAVVVVVGTVVVVGAVVVVVVAVVGVAGGRVVVGGRTAGGDGGRVTRVTALATVVDGWVVPTRGAGSGVPVASAATTPAVTASAPSAARVATGRRGVTAHRR